MANTTVNKISIGNEVLINLTEDTVSPEVLYSGYTAHSKSGAQITGTASGPSTIATSTKTPSSDSTSISFSSLSGKPIAFSVVATSDISRSSTSTNRYVVGIHYDGSTVAAENFALTGNRACSSHYVTSNITQSYSNGTLTIGTNSSTTGGYFRSGITYKLIYIY